MEPYNINDDYLKTTDSNPHLLITGSIAAFGGLIFFSLIIWLGMMLFNI